MTLGIDVTSVNTPNNKTESYSDNQTSFGGIVTSKIKSIGRGSGRSKSKSKSKSSSKSKK